MDLVTCPSVPHLNALSVASMSNTCVYLSSRART